MNPIPLSWWSALSQRAGKPQCKSSLLPNPPACVPRWSATSGRAGIPQGQFSVSSLRTPLAAIILILSILSASAQPAPHLVSPEVHPDHSVTFRLLAPNATKVGLNVEGQPAFVLQRDPTGIWTITTPPLEPDFYGYTFTVDGARTLDPNNVAVKPGVLSLSNFLHIPGPATLSWELGQVPHGEVHHHFYHSEICGDDRDYLVYTPPGYDPNGAERYPTLYLLHGFGDDATGWVVSGRANVILDNLIAEHKAKPMVVVMPLGYGTMEIVARARSGNNNMRAGGMPLFLKNGALFQKALLEEVLPQVEKDYRLSPVREDRAITGLSMGGGESLQTGLSHPDVFGWVGAFSAGGIADDIPSDFAAIDPAKDAQLKLLWIACGTADGLFPFNEKLRAYFTSKGIPHTDISTPRAHVWMVWRRNLTAFAPLLFR